LKIITHHMGGMIPYFADKIALGFRQIFHGEMDRNPAAADAGLKRQPIEYFRMLYGDTALNGSAAATKCGHAFFTTERSLFATDAPFDSEGGRVLIGRTIAAIDALEIPDAERQRIFSGNAKALLRLA
jgi:predicted TIM-barrel fold metal-dependent hydrolase